MTNEITEVEVRGRVMRLNTETRALRLCARMNRELEVLDFIDSIVEQGGGTLFDLGACEGRFAIYAALSGITCYAFEPEQRNFEVLLDNISHNGGDRLALHAFQLAIGSSDRVTELSIGQPWSGGHHRTLSDITRRVDMQFSECEFQTVNVVALDSFLYREKLPMPDFLKVDIDGAEEEFVNGAKNTLSSGLVKGVLFELCTSDPAYERIIKQMSVYGFSEERRVQIENDLYNFHFIRSSPKIF